MDKSWRPPLAWQDFELLCYELLAAEEPAAGHHHLYGRAGQDQHGVDILLHTHDESKPIGVQCKLRNELAGNELTENDVIKMYETSLKYSQGLRLLQIATTCQRDTEVQDMCAQISNSWQRHYRVQTLFWQDFERLLNKHEAVACRFYPEAFAPERCVSVDQAGKLNVALPREGWEHRLSLFFSHEVFRTVAGQAAGWLYVVISELVDNALDPCKGKASMVRLALGANYLEIFDDGKQFDSTSASLPPYGRQFGLRAIQETVTQSASALVHTYQPADFTKTRFNVNRIAINLAMIQAFDPCRSATQLRFILSREEARRYVATLPFDEKCESYTLRLNAEGLIGISHSASVGLLDELSRRLGSRKLILEVDSKYLSAFTEYAGYYPTVTIHPLP
ncbi:MAG TPA: hypothetical protein VJQ54_15070 [Candidatus Sulfotelmatobacter sp.]|nr:hypothetical protein [Candidatus Sulfotelmatobacter sp.]